MQGPSTPRFKIPKRTATAEVAKDVSSPEGTVVPKQQGFTGGRILPSAICATRGDSVISKKGKAISDKFHYILFDEHFFHLSSKFPLKLFRKLISKNVI